MAALESQRATLGDDFVDTALAPLRRRLEAMQASRPVLRQVTIVFLDIVGSTRLGQRLDPEDIQAVVDGALARFTALEAERKTIQTRTQEAQSRRNTLSKQIGMMKGKGEDTTAVMAEVAGLGDEQKQLETRLSELQAELSDFLMGVPKVSV